MSLRRWAQINEEQHNYKHVAKPAPDHFVPELRMARIDWIDGIPKNEVVNGSNTVANCAYKCLSFKDFVKSQANCTVLHEPKSLSDYINEGLLICASASHRYGIEESLVDEWRSQLLGIRLLDPNQWHSTVMAVLQSMKAHDISIPILDNDRSEAGNLVEAYNAYRDGLVLANRDARR